MMKFILEWIKDKNSNSKFLKFFQTPNFQKKNFIPKFSIPHSQCPILKSKPSIFKISKKFKPQISWPKFQNPKSQNFRFQVPNFNTKSQSFKVPKYYMWISKLSSFKNQMFLKNRIFWQLNFSWQSSKSRRNIWKSHISKKNKIK